MGLGTEVETSLTVSTIFEVEPLFAQAVINPIEKMKMVLRQKVRMINPARAESRASSFQVKAMTGLK